MELEKLLVSENVFVALLTDDEYVIFSRNFGIFLNTLFADKYHS